ncbi:MAG: hypothetical protein FWE76_06615, partial [Symbiobacteriaceae bacterium]|nr:hypothetical protein [Symbiobacteriaceae bacterium]
GFIPGITQYLTGTGANHPEKQSGPKKCVKCRVCEAKCPQSIAIADELTAVLKRMEPFWFSFVLWVVNKIM